MRRLLQTFRRRGERHDDQNTDISGQYAFGNNSYVPLPLLSKTRRPITPPGNTSSGTPDQLVAALGTLARLPPELRRRVLIAAFGERTLHIDLRLAPRGQQPTRSEWSSAEDEHGRGMAPLSFSRRVYGSATKSTKTKLGWPGRRQHLPKPEPDWEWRWYGCVCHRMIQRGSKLEEWCTARGHSSYVWPHRDRCIWGYAEYCRVWPTGPIVNPPHATSPIATCDSAIGALGWLRACRQAYLEGIHVLYSTNTFNIESRDLLDALTPPEERRRRYLPPLDRYLLVPHRLATVQSLELRLDIVVAGEPPRTRPLSPGHNRQKQILISEVFPHLANLSIPFPNLRTLVVSFSDIFWRDSRYRPVGHLPQLDEVFFLPLARSLSHVAQQLDTPVVVELPSNVFDDLSGHGLDIEERALELGHGHRYWFKFRDPVDESGQFYYIKNGEESDLRWDFEGNPFRSSTMPSVLL